jgi:hypothetical protein
METELSKREILNELPEIKNQIIELLAAIDKISFNNIEVKTLDGKIYSKEEILALIIDATGYKKWEFDQTEELNSKQIISYKETYAIDFKEKSIFCYKFTRETSSRDALWLISVTVLPGFFQVNLDTGRVGYSLNGLVNEQEFVKGIAAEFEPIIILK